MSLILHLETSTKVCSACIGRNGELLAYREVQEKNFSHSENLTLFVEAILQESNISIKELDAIAISEGPGSYTGLRIGTSTAKGLCFALHIPLIVIPTLEILAHQYKQEDVDYIVPLLDARRMEVFYAVYDAQLELVQETRAEEIGRGKVQSLKSARAKEAIPSPCSNFPKPVSQADKTTRSAFNFSLEIS